MKIKISNLMQRGKELVHKFGVRGGMALVDQAAVGAAGLVVSIIVGQCCGKAELGLFALGMTLVILLVGMLESLITSPFVVFVSRLEPRERAAYAGSVLVQYSLLLAMVSLLLAIAAAVTHTWQLGPTGLPAVLATLAALAPFRLLRELARRLAYAELNIRSALFVGLTVLVLQVGSVQVLAWSGRLNAITALAAIAISSGIAGGLWLVVHRRNFKLIGGKFRWAMARSYQLGRWFFASQTLSIFASHTIPWLVAIAIGTEQAGVYAACAMIVGLANPLVTSISNMITPITSHAFASDGAVGVRQVVRRAGLMLGGLALAMCLSLGIAGNWLVSLLFGTEFTGYGTTITLLALGEAFYIASMPASRAIMVFERPVISFLASLMGIAAMLTVSLIAMPYWGVTGAAAGRVAGSVLCSAVMTGSYFMLSHYLCREQLAADAALAPEVEAAASLSQSSSSPSPAYASTSALVENAS